MQEALKDNGMSDINLTRLEELYHSQGKIGYQESHLLAATSLQHWYGTYQTETGGSTIRLSDCRQSPGLLLGIFL